MEISIDTLGKKIVSLTFYHHTWKKIIVSLTFYHHTGRSIEISIDTFGKNRGCLLDFPITLVDL